MRVRVVNAVCLGLGIASLILLAVMAGLAKPKVAHAKWDGKVFSCPGGTYTWVSEPEALKGKKNYVYCVPVRELKGR